VNHRLLRRGRWQERADEGSPRSLPPGTGRSSSITPSTDDPTAPRPSPALRPGGSRPGHPPYHESNDAQVSHLPISIYVNPCDSAPRILPEEWSG